LNVGVVYRSLVDEDFKVLLALERALARREYAPLQLIERLSGIHEEKLVLILRKLHGLKLVKRETIAGEKMYRLTYLGYDVLAIRSLANANVIEAIGDKIGVGKESELYLALAPGGVQVALKFLRIGRRSFRQTRRTRIWARGEITSWYEQSKLAAEREYKALLELHPKGTSVPRPHGYSRHVVVIEYIDGVELYERPPLSDPGVVLAEILNTISKAYHEVGIVHGDLSEYNIIIRKSDERPFIIDWPQYVYRDDPSARDLIKRDVYYIVRFFRKVYGVEKDPEEALREILEARSS
jgi:RIO kinase 2